MANFERISFCRICSGGCGVRLAVDQNERIVSIRADKDSPLSGGYACFKGLQAAESHQGPARLLHPLKRMSDGSYVRIETERALDEIAGKLQRLVDEHGAGSAALFMGNGTLFNVPAYYMARSFLAALGSDQYFSTLTIDQWSKWVSFGRLGGWRAGFADIAASDVMMFIGSNPLVSHAGMGFLQSDPVRTLKRARADGLKVIVVDPRITETARNADMVLQPYPGQDAAIAGAMLRLILEQGWEDKDFCAQHVGADRMEALRRAVDPMTLDYVAARAGLSPEEIHAATQLFARDSKVGSVFTATGLSMSPFSNLAQHLADSINVICGRFLRAGDQVHQLNAMIPEYDVLAEVIPPSRSWESEGRSRIRGMRKMFGERLSGTLSDEILTPGEGQIKALIVAGGDPISSLPDRGKTAEAMESLELLVSIEPWRSLTSHYAHYILPPVMQYERADMSMHLGSAPLWPGAWAQYTAPAVMPPAGSDLLEEWYVFWAIAKRLGKAVVYKGTTPIDMSVPPSTDELIDIILDGAQVSLADLKRYPSGLDIGTVSKTVLPARPTAQGKFDPMPDDVAQELCSFLATPGTGSPFVRDGVSFTHLLTTRRMRDMFNSNGRHVRSVRKRTPYNPAYLNPLDLAALDLLPGDHIELISGHGAVVAIVGEDAMLRRGVVSMSHGWGGLPGGDNDPAVYGAAVNDLIDTDRNFEWLNAMPHMSAVPVNIRPLKASPDLASPQVVSLGLRT